MEDTTRRSSSTLDYNAAVLGADSTSTSTSHPHFPQNQHDTTSNPQSQRQQPQSLASISSFPQITQEPGNDLMTTVKSNVSGAGGRRSTANSMASRQTPTSTITRAENIRPKVRCLPSWVVSHEAGDDSGQARTRATQPLIAPSPVHSATHHFGSTPTVATPATRSQGKRVSLDGWISDYDEDEVATLPAEKTPERNLFGAIQRPPPGRKWDHLRTGSPIIVQHDDTKAMSSWVAFMKSSTYGPAPTEEVIKVSPEFLNELTPGLEKPYGWRGDLEDGLGLSRKEGPRRTWYERIQHSLLEHWIVPLAFRTTVSLTSITALAISAAIYHQSEVIDDRNSSTVMAIVVDTVALPYILYMTIDEYKSKPIGLRPAKAKMMLLLLDLFFIIFEGVNASLAFDALSDPDGVCELRKADPQEDLKKDLDNLCHMQGALGAILLVALLAWGLTFSISIFRLVERVGAREE